MMDRERKWKIYFHDLDKNKCGEFSHLKSVSSSYPLGDLMGDEFPKVDWGISECKESNCILYSEEYWKPMQGWELV